MSRFRQPWLVRSVAVIFAASAGLLLAQPAAGGAANDLVRWLVAGGALAIFVAVIAAWRWATSAIVREAVAAALEAHDGDEHAHAAAAEHNHRGMNERLDALTTAIVALTHTVDTLVAEHRLITGIKSGAPLAKCVRVTDSEADILTVLRQRLEQAEHEGDEK